MCPISWEVCWFHHRFMFGNISNPDRNDSESRDLTFCSFYQPSLEKKWRDPQSWQAIVDELMKRGMPSRTAHSLGWWLWRKRYADADAPVLQQRRQRWEELGEEGNESESEVEEVESLGENETIWGRFVPFCVDFDELLG